MHAFLGGFEGLRRQWYRVLQVYFFRLKRGSVALYRKFCRGIADGRVVRGGSIGGDKSHGNCVLKRILERRIVGDFRRLIAKSAARTHPCDFLRSSPHSRTVKFIDRVELLACESRNAYRALSIVADLL